MSVWFVGEGALVVRGVYSWLVPQITHNYCVQISTLSFSSFVHDTNTEALSVSEQTVRMSSSGRVIVIPEINYGSGRS